MSKDKKSLEAIRKFFQDYLSNTKQRLVKQELFKEASELRTYERDLFQEMTLDDMEKYHVKIHEKISKYAKMSDAMDKHYDERIGDSYEIDAETLKEFNELCADGDKFRNEARNLLKTANELTISAFELIRKKYDIPREVNVAVNHEGDRQTGLAVVISTDKPEVFRKKMSEMESE